MAFGAHISCADNNHLVSDEPGTRSDSRNLGSWDGQPHATHLIEPISRQKLRGLCRLSPTAHHHIPIAALALSLREHTS